jgi:hypothetical protein
VGLAAAEEGVGGLEGEEAHGCAIAQGSMSWFWEGSGWCGDGGLGFANAPSFG